MALTPKREFKAALGEAELRQGWRWTCWSEVAAGALCLISWFFWPQWIEAWIAAAWIEASLTMATLTLTDIATRLEKKPSLLVGLLISAGVGVMYLGEVGFAFAAAVGDAQSWLASLLAVWTIGQRAHIVWTMPQGDALDRMRHRALAGDRAFMLILLGAATFLIAFLTADQTDAWWQHNGGLIPLAYALLAFFTAARSYYLLSPRFAAKPRALLYDILGVDYLARL